MNIMYYRWTMHLPANLWCSTQQITTLKCLSSRLAVVVAKSIEARCLIANEGVVGALQAGDTPTTSEWSIILLHTKRYIRDLKVSKFLEWRYRIRHLPHFFTKQWKVLLIAKLPWITQIGTNREHQVRIPMRSRTSILIRCGWFKF